ncbi:MAG: amidohydrolase family protein [Longimicrobiales bacterium]
MRIDSHQHFWIYQPETHSWIDDRMHVLRRDFLPAELETHLSQCGVAGCVAVQAAQSLEETRWLLRLADRHEFIRGVVGWVDLVAPDLLDTLEELSSHARFKGVRHIVQSEADGFLENPAFQRGVAALARFGLTYDILIYAHQLPAALEFVARLPGVRFVLDHLAKPDLRRGELEPWATAMGRIAAHPNVCCKLSGLVTEAVWGAWQQRDLLPFLDTALEAFGADRLLFGSDWPVCMLAASYDAVVETIEQYVQRLGPPEQAAILGGNATRVYRLS